MDERAALFSAAADVLRARLDSVAGLVLFGSYARGDEGPQSDLDVLVVLRETSLRRAQRYDAVAPAMGDLRRTDAWARWRTLGRGPELSPLVLTMEECRQLPPILLDIASEGILLWDGGGVRELPDDIRRRMARAGVRRVEMPDGRRYWDLRPGLLLGESVEF